MQACAAPSVYGCGLVDTCRNRSPINRIWIPGVPMTSQATLIQLLWGFRIHWELEPLQTQDASIPIERQLLLLIPMESKEEEMCRGNLKEEMGPQRRNLIAITQVRWRLCIRPLPTILSLFATSIRKCPYRHRS